MTGKAYYLTTLGDWRRHAARFATSHFVILDADSSSESPLAFAIAGPPDVRDDAKILALIEADEGAHLALEDDAAFEQFPHPLTQKSISSVAQAALAPQGIPLGATTFDVAETLARIHPLLRHRVF